MIPYARQDIDDADIAAVVDRIEIHTERLLLRELGESDVSDAYLAWLNDPLVNQYLETRFSEQTLERIRAFVLEKSRSDVEFLFGIFHAGRHIGNIKLGPIHRRHRLADVSYLIGARDMWGRGVASEAIRAVSLEGFRRFGLNKLSAGVYAPNIASARALEKAGYQCEGVRLDHYFLGEESVDLFDYGLRRVDVTVTDV